MKALILAAGYGTRLAAIATNTPKPLLEVGSKPLIEHILDRLFLFEDLNEVLVVTNDKFYGHFQEWAKKFTGHRVKMTVLNDGTKTNEDRLGSVGDIHFALQQKKINDSLIVVGGDNLFDFDLKAFYAFAKGKPKDSVTIGVYDIHSIPEATKFGVVELGKDGKIISFEEKPEKPKSSLIAMCFYYFTPATVNLVFNYLKESKKADKAGDYIRWLSEHNNVYAYTFTGTWYDIGSVESYREAQEKFKA